MSADEMEALGWDSCDIIVVTGDAYVDHPSFGMAIVGRVLEAQGFRVGILSQPDWTSAEPFKALGKPNLFFGITAGNMDSMVNRYTSDRRMRSDDAYTPGGMAGKRPDRSVIVYAQRAREAYRDVPIVVGGIEASLRRIAHYDHWSEKIRRSILVDSQADLLLYGNAERALVEVAHRLAARKPISSITDIRGTAYWCDGAPEGWREIDSTTLDTPGRAVGMPNPYLKQAGIDSDGAAPMALQRPAPVDRGHSVVRLPSYESVAADRVMYAHASRVMHLETNPGNARALIQR
ncbi:MAG TPA: YgiQ family radical SAM protein, partial [Candidatus Binatia bacterium]|nr:YgiQ family radical SAM protein [Candidatus Binatia bacterium]